MQSFLVLFTKRFTSGAIITLVYDESRLVTLTKWIEILIETGFTVFYYKLQPL